MKPLKQVALPDGQRVAALGQGTWEIGDHRSTRAAEKSALARGIELGMTLIDTAEMYGNGASETLVGEVIAGRRESVFIVDKVLPGNASRRGTVQACERSLKRLGTDHIDLYLLHWSGPHPLAETVAAFEQLQRDGKIRYWGVSNLDLGDMQALFDVPGGSACATNQLLYNLGRRGIEFDLLPWMAQRAMPVMAYSPIERGELDRHDALAAIGARHQASAVQVALAWLLSRPATIVIPKASSVEHVQDNRAAAEITLSPDDLRELDTIFKPPTRARPLEML